MQDEFYPECPECGGVLLRFGEGHAMTCPECGWFGDMIGMWRMGYAEDNE